MKKVFMSIIVVLLILVVVAVFARDMFARAFFTNALRKITGLEVKTSAIRIGLSKSFVAIEGLEVSNPAGFPDKLMIQAPEIYVAYDLGAFFKQKVHLSEIRIDIAQLAVIQDKSMKLNVNSLALLLPKPSGQKPPEVKIDTLKLKIGKVVYKNYGLGPEPKAVEFNPNIDETFTDVTDPSKITSEILVKVLSRLGISDLASFGTKTFKEEVAKIEGQAKTAAGEAVNKAKEGLQNIFKP